MTYDGYKYMSLAQMLELYKYNIIDVRCFQYWLTCYYGNLSV